MPRPKKNLTSEDILSSWALRLIDQAKKVGEPIRVTKWIDPEQTLGVSFEVNPQDTPTQIIFKYKDERQRMVRTGEFQRPS